MQASTTLNVDLIKVLAADVAGLQAHLDKLDPADIPDLSRATVTGLRESITALCLYRLGLPQEPGNEMANRAEVK